MCLKISELLKISSIDSVCYPQLIRSIFVDVAATYSVSSIHYCCLVKD